MSIRTRLAVWSLVCDVAALGVAFEVAVALHRLWRDYGGGLFAVPVDWSLPVGLGVTLATCYGSGLYKLEAYISRPLHVVTVFKAAGLAVIVLAFAAFALKAEIVTESRFIVFTTLGLFFVAAGFLRIGLVDRLYRRDVRRRPGPTVVVGRSMESGVLVSRLKELRGYGKVVTLEPRDRRVNGNDADTSIIAALRSMQPAPRHVFVDAASVGHKATLQLLEAARARGAEAYIAGHLVGPLDSTRLLIHLFELPVMRVRAHPLGEKPSAAKRAFDVVAAGAALVVLSPLFAAIALAVKLDSPGPVFFRQERVGLRGRPFRFLKFRSMRDGNDPAVHREYVARLINGGEAAATNDDGHEVYKLEDDGRVTRVGRVLRKYSLDELPQLWNVLRGDMSVVGPRPALDYEVEAYKDWHRLRLQVTPGLTGLWQVAGRSRVGFDEMVFQDVMYTFNQSLLTDLGICVRTVPVVLQGKGAA